MSELDQTPFVRVCPKCRAQSGEAGAFCPHCGTSYVKASRRLNRRTTIALSVAGALVLAGIGGVVAVRQHEAGQREEAVAAAQQAAESDARDREAAQTEADETERAGRAELVTYLEKEITKDAKESVSDGVLDGPIKFTQCTATGGGSTDDLTSLTGTFECLAANVENDDGTIEGYAYSGTAEWDTGSISWHLGR